MYSAVLFILAWCLFYILMFVVFHCLVDSFVWRFGGFVWCLCLQCVCLGGVVTFCVCFGLYLFSCFLSFVLLLGTSFRSCVVVVLWVGR